MRLTPLLCFLVLLLALSSNAPAQQRIQLGKDDLAPGLFLVAPREPADETFAHTVILLIRHDDTGTLGLVINQPTEIPLARVFAHLKSARHLSEVAYSGGPVQNDAVLALSRSRAKERDAQTILNDLYLVASEKQLERVLRATPSTKNLRVYLGYTGWAPGQLEHEMDLDVWRVLPGDDDSIFDADPSKVWPRLIERTELRFAGLAGSTATLRFIK